MFLVHVLHAPSQGGRIDTSCPAGKRVAVKSLCRRTRLWKQMFVPEKQVVIGTLPGKNGRSFVNSGKWKCRECFKSK
jgi:hypothetical protein